MEVGPIGHFLLMTNAFTTMFHGSNILLENAAAHFQNLGVLIANLMIVDSMKPS